MKFSFNCPTNYCYHSDAGCLGCEHLNMRAVRCDYRVTNHDVHKDTRPDSRD